MTARDKVIRPAMREFADLLEERLIRSLISVDDRRSREDGPSLSISLRVFVRCSLSDALPDVPHYMARWDADRSLVQLTMSDHTRHYGGTSRSDGSIALGELTRPFLEKRLLGFTGWILR